MTEYKLIGKNNRPVTCYNFEETKKSIEMLFPETDANKMIGGVRKTYGVNGESFYVYYRNQSTSIILPQEYEESIKEKLEVIAELKFEKVKCQ